MAADAVPLVWSSAKLSDDDSGVDRVSMPSDLNELKTQFLYQDFSMMPQTTFRLLVVESGAGRLS